MKQIIVLLLSTAMGVIMMSCKESGTNPPEEKPPGYQEDIPWPSLADSPWPMNHHDPQNTGRSKFNGPVFGILDTVISTPELHSGFACSNDSFLYFTGSSPLGGLMSSTLNGTINWRSYAVGWSYTAPIIAKDGTIYYLGGSGLAALNSEGSVKWIYNINSTQTLKLFTIDKNGNLYFFDGSEHSIKSIDKNGNLVWTFTDPRFNYLANLQLGNNFAFSPDGKILYVNAVPNKLLAIDISNSFVKWEFEKIIANISSGSIIGPLIDSNGSVYLNYQENDGTIFFTQLNESGAQNWKIKLYRPLDEQPTIDKNGNIYFATDTLYCSDYFGNLKWKKALGTFLASNLVCDKNGNIFVCLHNPTLKVLCFDSKGNEKWSLEAPLYGTINSSPAIINEKLFLSANNYTNFYIIK